MTYCIFHSTLKQPGLKNDVPIHPVSEGANHLSQNLFGPSNLRQKFSNILGNVKLRLALIKNKIKFSSFIRKFRLERLQSYMSGRA